MMPEGWKTYKIKEVASVFTGFPFDGSLYNSSVGVKVLRGENVTIGRLRWDMTKFWNEEFKPEYYLKPCDIVIGMDGSRVGKNKAQIRSEDLPLLLAQRVARLRANIGFDQNYLSYAINNERFENYVSVIKTGTTIPHISPSQIKDYEFQSPENKPEQSRIASILSSLDDKIELNLQMNKTLESIAQTIFNEWFVDFRFPGFDGELVGGLPRGWRRGKISEICEVTDFVANGSFASLAEKVKYQSKPDYAVLIRLTDYNRGFNGDFVYVSESGYKFLKKSSLEGGEIIVANVGANAGDVFLAPHLNRPITLGPNAIMIKKNKFTNYLYLLFTSYFGQLLIKGIISGSAQPKFNKTDFRKLELIIPDIAILEQFNGFYLALQNKVISNRKQIQSLTLTRDILLPKLMTGQIRV